MHLNTYINVCLMLFVCYNISLHVLVGIERFQINEFYGRMKCPLVC